MSRYILRLDDASDYMNIEKWKRMENLLDKYNIKPLAGIIPENQDPSLVGVYERDPLFWNKVNHWKEKGWELALHGCNHKYVTEEGGMNPVNKRSEFAGVPLEEQCIKIRIGMKIFREHEIEPRIFFAPSHTFDQNTLEALKKESNIRIISDTIANDVYYQEGFYFIPQQSGKVRKLPFKVCTFCYHPNMMKNRDFEYLEAFLKKKYSNFVSAQDMEMKKRPMSAVDKMLRAIYFAKRR
jgi:predicted deacetylase